MQQTDGLLSADAAAARAERRMTSMAGRPVGGSMLGRRSVLWGALLGVSFAAMAGRQAKAASPAAPQAGSPAASPPSSPTAPSTADDAALDAPLAGLYAGLESVMKAGRSTPFQKRFDTLAPAVEQAFDLETVLKVSVGLDWESMDQPTRSKLLAAFRRFTIATYVANFDTYSGQKFKILPGSRAVGADRIVGTEILNGSDAPLRLDYVMRQVNGAWRAVDVLLDGSISRVAVQRSDFRHILGAGNASALIASLNRKVADLSGGALSS